jgi:hypothetical protein
MAITDSNIIKLAPEAGSPAYRVAPHNIEAEQACSAPFWSTMTRSTGSRTFLEPKHFFEPIHQLIFETSGSLIRAGKIATPVTLKTFVPADTDLGGITGRTVPRPPRRRSDDDHQRADYGRTIYDLAIRRDLIRLGEDMVNVAFDAPVDFAPRAQIEDAEKKLYEIAESGRYDGGFQKFSQALTIAVDMAAAPIARRQPVGHRLRPARPRHQDGRPATVRPDHPRRDAPPWARPRSPPTSPSTSPATGAARCRPTAQMKIRRRRHRRLLLAGNVGRAARHPYHRRAHRHLRPHKIRRGGITEADFDKIASTLDRDAERCRSMSTRPAACRSPSSPRARGG